ncbi:MAG TPA: SWIM zinc finger family protein, partial [Methylomirabilota bacterium]|nr:SWIM zinc finger family protein [Methylomirabilota bacterium]
ADPFPIAAGELRTECSCPDWANPCKHVAAVHYVLGEFLDRDPLLLFELRGRPRARLLADLRRARAGAPEAPRGARAPRRAAGETAAPAPGEATAESWAPERYATPRGRLDDLRFHVAPAAGEGALLRRLGPPPSWHLAAPPADWLQPVVARAAALALELALGGADEGA